MGRPGSQAGLPRRKEPSLRNRSRELHGVRSGRAWNGDLLPAPPLAPAASWACPLPSSQFCPSELQEALSPQEAGQDCHSHCQVGPSPRRGLINICVTNKCSLKALFQTPRPPKPTPLGLTVPLPPALSPILCSVLFCWPQIPLPDRAARELRPAFVTLHLSPASALHYHLPKCGPAPLKVGPWGSTDPA